MRRFSLLLAVLALALPAGVRAEPSGPLLLGQGVVGRPVVTPQQVYFVESHAAAGSTGILVYDSASGATLELKRGEFTVAALAADGARLVWLERAAGRARVQTMHLSSRREQTLLDDSAAQGISELALSGQTLIYNLHGPDGGVWARELAGGAPRRLGDGGSGLVAGDGMLLWSAMRPVGAAFEWWLSLNTLDGQPSTVVARSPSPFSGYDVAGDVVVWSALPPAAERRVWLYRITDGTVLPLSEQPARFPRLAAGRVLWFAEPACSGPALGPAALESSDLTGGRRSSLHQERPGALAAWGLLGQSHAVWSDDVGAAGGRRLWLGGLSQDAAGSVPRFSGLESAATRRLCGTPLSCGQLAVNGQYLEDAGGRWDVRGVQFFLPRWGINAWTFYDSNYWSEQAEVDAWLDVARYRLRARLLRIFVELPDGEWQPTAHETVYDFAQRAGARGMRLGIVIQNSADFRMTPERSAWLGGLVDYFAQRGATPLIAYISAANEINNWCSRRDCFDQSPSYVDAAIAWTGDVAATVKARDARVLVTVGLSTEVDDSDGLPATYDFFRSDNSGRSLAGAVDFLAPHNYAGGAYGVYDDLRYTYGYSGPIVLEEFGWTTDPLADDPRFTEGAIACVADPWTAACRNTGPYYVEWSLRALREVPYAGGVAWMLADVATKDCASDPSDLWSGLFAAGLGYCGGTRSIAPAQGKATAARVAVYFGADDLYRLTYLPVVRSR